MTKTPVSLLERLRQPAPQAAWDRFVALYTPLMLHWARRLGLAEAEAADLVQDVFVVLVQELPKFTYRAGERFRGWLWTVVVNKWRERRRRAAARPAEVGGAVLDDQVAPASIVPLEETEYRQYL